MRTTLTTLIIILTSFLWGNAQTYTLEDKWVDCGNKAQLLYPYYSPGVTFTWDGPVKDGKADGDPNLLAIIDNIDAEAKGAQRGNINGPSRDYAAVNGNSYMDYTASFIANELAEILVSGDGDTDLDLYVYDSNGNLIAQDTDYSDDCYVRWVPAWTSRYTIRIVNRGPVYNRFVILTN